MGHRREAQNPGRTKCVCLRTVLQVGLGAVSHEDTCRNTNPKPAALLQGSEEPFLIHVVISSNSSRPKEPEQLLLHWIPRNGPFPGLQLCKRSPSKPDAADFQDGSPPDVPNLKSQLPSHLRFPRLLLGKD